MDAEIITLAENYLSTGRLMDAMVLATRAHKRVPSVQTQLLLAKVSLAKGDFAAAHGYAAAILQRYPNHAAAAELLLAAQPQQVAQVAAGGTMTSSAVPVGKRRK